jgi:hypothetical protein
MHLQAWEVVEEAEESPILGLSKNNQSLLIIVR